METSTAEPPRHAAAARAADPDFIVGSPRSGSTLIEQILRRFHSRSKAHTTSLPTVPRISTADLDGRQTSHPDAPDHELEEFAGKDICRRPERTAPRADPVHRQDAEQLPPYRPDPSAAAEREDHRCAPRANGLLLRQLQAAVRPGPGVHLWPRRHRALLPHLPRPHALLGGSPSRAGLASELRRCRARPGGQCSPAAAVLRLEFEPACVEFHRTERSVRTASSEQVRQPIYREGLSQWRHYEPWLAPLRETLGTPWRATANKSVRGAMPARACRGPRPKWRRQSSAAPGCGWSRPAGRNRAESGRPRARAE